MTFNGATLTSMQLTSFGTYVYGFTGSLHGSADTVTLNIVDPAAASVPEPASHVMLTSIALAGGFRVYRRKAMRGCRPNAVGILRVNCLPKWRMLSSITLRTPTTSSYSVITNWPRTTTFPQPLLGVDVIDFVRRCETGGRFRTPRTT